MSINTESHSEIFLLGTLLKDWGYSYRQAKEAIRRGKGRLEDEVERLALERQNGTQ